MTEIIRCPGCSTRFALRPERVHVGTRRAKCFKCETVFEIGEAVERLLAQAEPEALPPPLPGPPPVPPRAETPFAPAPPEPPPVPAGEDSPFAAFAPAPPSLTLGDLEGADEEIMEKTLVLLPPPPPEAPVPAEAAEAASTGGYTSAKDAIARLMGTAPAAPAQGDRRQVGNRNSMDVEATLDALEVTLSGNAAPPPAPSDATASTMKLTAQEIQAAMASFPVRPMPPPAPAPLGPPPGLRAAQPPPPKPLEPLPTSQGADLLKIQLEQETLNNVTLDQVTTWIEQGRVHEYHMVARQFSDHWIEAVKVPALRPVFDRKRRDDAGKPMDLPMPPDLAPAKKSLFGGLFGKN